MEKEGITSEEKLAIYQSIIEQLQEKQYKN